VLVIEPQLLPPRAVNAGSPSVAPLSNGVAQFPIFVGLNGLAVVMVALFHTYTAPSDITTDLSLSALFGLVCLETSVLLLPALIAWFSLRTWRSRLATQVGIALTIAATTLYALDLVTYLAIGEHLLSDVFWKLFQSILPFLGYYVTLSLIVTISAAIAGWLFLQWLTWQLAGYSSRKLGHRLEVKNVPAVAGLCVSLVGLALWQPLWHQARTFLEMQTAAERHPIAALGWIPTNVVRLSAETDPDRIRGTALLLAEADRIKAFKQRYIAQQVTRAALPATEASPPATNLADVVIVIAESVRSDALTPTAAPNLTALAGSGLRLSQHWSVANSSDMSFFGLMTGLDAAWYEHAEDLPIGLFAWLQQAGYETAFIGRNGFDQFGMERFVNEDRFDHLVMLSIADEVACDKETVRQSVEFFEREGAFATPERKPRVAIVYLYSSHWKYTFEAEDEVYPSYQEPPLPPPYHPSDCEGMFNRYLNSVHFVDRIIQPLLKPDRLVVFAGDHGEGFGEGGRFMHGSALSVYQSQVGCVMFGPGIPARSIDRPTSHADIVPTVLDALGLKLSDPTVLAGRSWLQPIPDDRIVAVRRFQSHENLFITTPTEESIGYLGFANFDKPMLAPGAKIDKLGEPLPNDPHVASPTDKWQAAAPMRQWLARTLGEPLGTIPADPIPLLRQALRSPSPAIRLQTVHAIQVLADGTPLLDDLEPLLSDPAPEVQQATFDLVLKLHRDAERRL